MQQTDTYKLNLIEGTDDFLPDALNENMEKLEEVMASQAQSVAALAANLGTAGKNARIAWGSYVGTGACGASAPNSLQFEFCPTVVFVGSYERTSFGSWPSVFLRPCSRGGPDIGGNSLEISWHDNGLSWYNTQHADSQNNSAGYTYYYIAIGYSNN